MAPNDLECVRLKRIVDSMRSEMDAAAEEVDIRKVSPQRGKKWAA